MCWWNTRLVTKPHYSVLYYGVITLPKLEPILEQTALWVELLDNSNIQPFLEGCTVVVYSFTNQFMLSVQALSDYLSNQS